MRQFLYTDRKTALLIVINPFLLEVYITQLSPTLETLTTEPNSRPKVNNRESSAVEANDSLELIRVLKSIFSYDIGENVEQSLENILDLVIRFASLLLPLIGNFS